MDPNSELAKQKLTFLEFLLATPKPATAPFEDELSNTSSNPQSIPPKSEISNRGGTGDLVVAELAARELLGVGKAVKGVGRVEGGRTEAEDDDEIPPAPAHSSESRGGAV